MRNLLSLVGFVVVVFLGLGYYLGWYQFGIAKGSNGNTQISFDVNTNKIKDDASKTASRAGEIVEGMKKDAPAEKKEAATVPDKSTPTAKAPAPGR